MAATVRKHALLLDLDGTVVDTHELIFQSYDWTMREHCGCQGSRQILEECTGLHLKEIFSATLDHFGVPITDDLLARAIHQYREHLRSNEASVTTFAGMRATLDAFAKLGWQLAIVTTKPAEGALRHLESQGLTSLFGAVITGDRCRNLKPHPEPFLNALAALNVPASAAIAVGDSEHDIRGARAAGATTVAACWGTMSRTKLLSAQPDFVAEQPTELLSLSF
jgi:pyrophosphatase PpaX